MSVQLFVSAHDTKTKQKNSRRHPPSGPPGRRKQRRLRVATSVHIACRPHASSYDDDDDDDHDHDEAAASGFWLI